MGRLCGDLALLATVGQMYGSEDGAQLLYCLATYGCNLATTMDPGDVEVGLGLIGIEAFRLVAPGQYPHAMTGHALAEGHVVLAQLVGVELLKGCTWVALTSADAEGWAGIMVGWDMIAHGVSSRLGAELTGHYVITATPLPGWDEPLPF